MALDEQIQQLQKTQQQQQERLMHVAPPPSDSAPFRPSPSPQADEALEALSSLAAISSQQQPFFSSADSQHSVMPALGTTLSSLGLPQQPLDASETSTSQFPPPPSSSEPDSAASQAILDLQVLLQPDAPASLLQPDSLTSLVQPSMPQEAHQPDQITQPLTPNRPPKPAYLQSEPVQPVLGMGTGLDIPAPPPSQLHLHVDTPPSGLPSTEAPHPTPALSHSQQEEPGPLAGQPLLGVSEGSGGFIVGPTSEAPAYLPLLNQGSGGFVVGPTSEAPSSFTPNGQWTHQQPGELSEGATVADYNHHPSVNSSELEAGFSVGLASSFQSVDVISPLPTVPTSEARMAEFPPSITSPSPISSPSFSSSPSNSLLKSGDNTVTVNSVTAPIPTALSLPHEPELGTAQPTLHPSQNRPATFSEESGYRVESHPTPPTVAEAMELEASKILSGLLHERPPFSSAASTSLSSTTVAGSVLMGSDNRPSSSIPTSTTDAVSTSTEQIAAMEAPSRDVGSEHAQPRSIVGVTSTTGLGPVLSSLPGQSVPLALPAGISSAVFVSTSLPGLGTMPLFHQALGSLAAPPPPLSKELMAPLPDLPSLQPSTVLLESKLARQEDAIRDHERTAEFHKQQLADHKVQIDDYQRQVRLLQQQLLQFTSLQQKQEQDKRLASGQQAALMQLLQEQQGMFSKQQAQMDKLSQVGEAHRQERHEAEVQYKQALAVEQEQKAGLTQQLQQRAQESLQLQQQLQVHVQQCQGLQLQVQQYNTQIQERDKQLLAFREQHKQIVQNLEQRHQQKVGQVMQQVQELQTELSKTRKRLQESQQRPQPALQATQPPPQQPGPPRGPLLLPMQPNILQRPPPPQQLHSSVSGPSSRPAQPQFAAPGMHTQPSTPERPPSVQRQASLPFPPGQSGVAGPRVSIAQSTSQDVPQMPSPAGYMVAGQGIPVSRPNPQVVPGQPQPGEHTVCNKDIYTHACGINLALCVQVNGI